jgi:hypothetical protein
LWRDGLDGGDGLDGIGSLRNGDGDNGLEGGDGHFDRVLEILSCEPSGPRLCGVLNVVPAEESIKEF